ncbi:MAG: helical backbone metal receptor, partial [Acidobacteriota bacterium]
MIWLLLLAAAVPERIVSTAPSFTEMLFALGAGDRVVAVSTYCHYPPAVDRLPRIGTYLEPNVEAIIRLRPNLVLVHAEHPQIVRQLRAAP